MILYTSGPDPDRPATWGDVQAAYRRNFRRFLILLVLVLVLAASFFGYTRAQYQDQSRRDHLSCLQRRSALVKANTFYQVMAGIESHNTFVNEQIRDQRVKAYEGNVYALPSC